MRQVLLPIGGKQVPAGPALAAFVRDNKAALRAAMEGTIDVLDMLDITCRLATACAQRVDASITLEQVEAQVDITDTAALFSACWGVTLPAPPPGESPAASPST